MTALAGYWSFGDPAGAHRSCELMLGAQAMYGQESAQWDDGGALALGRRIYRTLPEDAFDRSVKVGGGGRLALAADVRLDNRDELARDLGLAPDELRSMSDSHLLLRALERWDEGAVDRLVGDFAFALWDGGRRRLLLVRDYIGRRPLHYHRGGTFFAFASMPKGLHCLPSISYAPDVETAANFLALIPETGPRSFFKGISRVEPGHIVAIGSDRFESRRYWRPPTATLKLTGEDDYKEALREQLDLAVSARLRGAGDRVAAHLSAELDSSAVATTAARLTAGTSGVVAFTAVPRDGYDGAVPGGRIGDESKLAALTASLHPNMEHVRISTEGRSPIASLDRNFHLYERPLLNLCNSAWADAIKDSARDRGLKVLLSADMGNVGLSYSGEHLLPRLLAEGRIARLAGEALALRRNGIRLRSAASMAFGPWIPRALWRHLARLRGSSSGLESYSAISDGGAEAAGIQRQAAESGLDLAFRQRRDGTETRLWSLGRVDPGTIQKGNLAGWGIDGRDPTADRRLIEFCLSVPLDQYLSNGVFRSLARRALADRVPGAVLAERGKGYQAADWHEGLSAARETLHDEIERIAAAPPARDLIDVERLRGLASIPPDSDWSDRRNIRNYRHVLLRGLSTGHFLRRAMRSNG